MTAYIQNHLVMPVANKMQEGKTYITTGIRNGYNKTTESIHSTCVNGVKKLSEAARSATDKTAQFFARNSDKMLYGICCATNLYFAPALFITGAVLSCVIRIEVNRYLRDLAKEYLKPEKNFMEKNATPILTTADSAMATIGAVDAIALGTIFSSSSILINMLPFFGGVAAGSSIAKGIINYTNPEPKPEQTVLPAPRQTGQINQNIQPAQIADVRQPEFKIPTVQILPTAQSAV
ncbi:MAG: hypothetical protein H0W88_07150 [Parachlamydiaceae bacterium]|nr:hypothetical protein [Parachlamydiaceae bacterium]